MSSDKFTQAINCYTNIETRFNAIKEEIETMMSGMENQVRLDFMHQFSSFDSSFEVEFCYTNKTFFVFKEHEGHIILSSFLDTRDSKFVLVKITTGKKNLLTYRYLL